MAVAAIGLLAAPAPAIAAAATKATDSFVEIFCDSLTGPAGTIFFGANVSAVNGPSGGLDEFGAGSVPFVDPVNFTSDPEQTVSGTYSAGQLSVAFPVV